MPFEVRLLKQPTGLEAEDHDWTKYPLEVKHWVYARRLVSYIKAIGGDAEMVKTYLHVTHRNRNSLLKEHRHKMFYVVTLASVPDRFKPQLGEPRLMTFWDKRRAQQVVLGFRNLGCVIDMDVRLVDKKLEEPKPAHRWGKDRDRPAKKSGYDWNVDKGVTAADIQQDRDKALTPKKPNWATKKPAAKPETEEEPIDWGDPAPPMDLNPSKKPSN